jgi:2-keto-4-pentenoate hydratase
MERLGIRMPLVGYMMQKSLCESARPCRSRLDPAGGRAGIAVHMAPICRRRRSRRDHAAIGALGPAIELADLIRRPRCRSHARRKYLSPQRDPRARRHGARGRQARRPRGLVFRRGAQVARQEDLQANVGNIVDIVAHVAGTLAAYGERLRAGDVIITGSIVPPPLIEADETDFAYTLETDGEAVGAVFALDHQLFAQSRCASAPNTQPLPGRVGAGQDVRAKSRAPPLPSPASGGGGAAA